MAHKYNTKFMSAYPKFRLIYEHSLIIVQTVPSVVLDVVTA